MRQRLEPRIFTDATARRVNPTAIDVYRTARQREGVDLARIDHVELVSGPLMLKLVETASTSRLSMRST